MEKFGGIAEFVATVEAGSFAQAGQRLGMTPSGVGKAVSRLEDRLRLSLLRRSTRRLVVTPAGAECYQKFRQFLFDLGEMEALSEPRLALRGTLRLHLPPALARTVIMPALPRFYGTHPEVTLHISMRNDMIDLVEEGVDLSVRIGHFDGNNVIARPLGCTKFVTVCSPEFARAMGQPELPEDLLRFNCLRYLSRQTGRPRTWKFSVDGAPLELSVAGNLVLNNTDSLIESARSNVGVAQVPYYAAEEALCSGGLIVLLEPFAAPEQEIQAIYSVSQRSSAKINAFIEFLRDVFDTAAAAAAVRHSVLTSSR